MFCILKYIDYVDYKKFQNQTESTFSGDKITSEDTDSLNLTLYFNPNAFLQLILEYICKELHFDINNNFDFCNESGDLVGIKDYKATASGLSVFHQRETYILVILTRNSNEELEDISPIIHPASHLYIIVTKRLKKKYFKSKRSVTSIKKRSSKNSVILSKDSSLMQRNSKSAN